MRRPLLAMAIIVALGIAGVAAWALRSHPGPGLTAARRDCGQAGSLIAVGQAIPGSCKVEGLVTGTIGTLAGIANGKPMVVNFWASWCSSCIQEMPDLQGVYAKAADQVQFLGLDLLDVDGEIRSAAVDFSRQRRVSYPLAYDDQGLLYKRISLRVLPPTTAFVKADGTLAGFHIGQMSAQELRGFLAQYLGIQVPA